MGSRLSRDVNEEEILPTHVSLDEVDLGDIELDVVDESKEIAEYCLPLLVLDFCGQTSCVNGDADVASVKDVLNLGLYLSLLDKFLKQFDNITDFTGEEEEYQLLLRLIAMKRYRKGDESVENCNKRLQKDSKRFVQIYKERGVKSEELGNQAYWGSRQQLLAGKVIGDWIDKKNGNLDPLFGVLLQPTAGRVGPGDTGWFHDMLFDDRGHMAYHSAVHDSFGYLITNHQVGPGYDYLKDSVLFSADNPLAGQYSGISFWKHTIQDIETKQKVLKCWRY